MEKKSNAGWIIGAIIFVILIAGVAYFLLAKKTTTSNSGGGGSGSGSGSGPDINPSDYSVDLGGYGIYKGKNYIFSFSKLQSTAMGSDPNLPPTLDPQNLAHWLTVYLTGGNDPQDNGVSVAQNYAGLNAFAWQKPLPTPDQYKSIAKGGKGFAPVSSGSSGSGSGGSGSSGSSNTWGTVTTVVGDIVKVAAV